MRIAQINMLHNGSTGRIMLQVAQRARENGHQVKTFSSPSFSFQGPEKLPQFPEHSYFGSYFSRGIHTIAGIITGGNGFFSVCATAKLIRQLKAFSPELIHLHNLHQFVLNLPMLFRYIKKSGVKVVWTLHDCWSFTGHCAYFDYAGCDKWKTGCHNCPQQWEYPKSYVDNSSWMYRYKKKWFTGIEDMTIVTPSQWLANLVRQSFLKEYPVQVINNGIDLNIFKPAESDYRRKLGCEDKFMVLGVAFDWGQRKGLDVMSQLAQRLGSDYQIVLVGTNDAVDAQLPENVISIHQTDNQAQLAQLYTAADLFVNPTREDNYPTVHMEALACGTPVLTFAVGGSMEMLSEDCGTGVARDDVDALEQQIRRVRAERPFTREACLQRARRFDMNDCFDEYVALYNEKNQEGSN